MNDKEKTVKSIKVVDGSKSAPAKPVEPAKKPSLKPRGKFLPLKLNRQKAILGGVCGLIAAIIIVLLVVIATEQPRNAEDAMRQVAEKYFVEKIAPSSRRSNSYTLILKNIKNLGYDVGAVAGYGCSDDTRAVIMLKNPDAQNSADLEYEISVQLDGC